MFANVYQVLKFDNYLILYRLALFNLNVKKIQNINKCCLYDYISKI